MNKAQKRLVSSLAAAASVAAVIAPTATVFAATKDEAKALVDNAKKTLAFVDYNQAYAAVVALPAADQAALLAELSPLWEKVATKDVTDVLTTMDSLAKNKDLKNYYDLYTMIEKTVTMPRNQQYLMGELTSWGKTAVFTPDVVAATDAVMKAWTSKSADDVAAAQQAAAKVTNAGSLAWLNAEVAKIVDATPVSVSSLNAVGAKKLEVKFNKAIDTTKATVTVKRGDVTQATSDVTYSADKTSAVITIAGKLVAGDYTVSVDGIADKAVSATVTAVDEKVSAVVVTGDSAIIATGSSTNATTLTFGYKVTNQYGENITDTADVQGVSNIGTLSTNKGTATITVTNGNTAKTGDKITVNLYNIQYVVSASSTLTVSDFAKISSINVTKLYNADSKTLTEDSTAGDFMLVLDAKDQYGNQITNAGTANSDLVVSVSNASVASVTGYNSTNNTATFAKVSIDGTDQLVLKLANNTSNALAKGTTVVTLISKSSGKSANFSVEVKDGVKVDTISFSQPTGTIAKDKSVRIPFTAYDVSGNAVTSASVLNKINLTGNNLNFNNPKFQTDYLTGQAYLEVTPTVEGVAVINAITTTNKTASISLTSKAAVKPASVVGIDDVATNALVGEAYKLNVTNLVVQDQYGNIMSDDTVKSAVTGGHWTITAKSNDSGVFKFDNGSDTKTLDGNDFKVVSVGTDKGSTTIDFVLHDVDNNKDISTFTLSTRAVALKEISSYTVDDLVPVFDEAGNTQANDSKYNETFSVYGLLSNNTKVFIPSVATDNSFYYTVRTNKSNLTVDQTSNTDKKTVLDVATTFDYGTDANNKGLSSKDYKAYVTINNTGDVFEKTVTISKDAPGVVTLKVNDKSNFESADTSKVIQDGTVTADGVEVGAVYQFTTNSTSLTGNDLLVNSSADHEGLLIMVDKYGKETTVANPSTGVYNFTTTGTLTKAITGVTFTSLSDANGDGSLKVANNGQTNASLTGVQDGDSFVVKYTVDNAKTVAVKVVVVKTN